MRLRTSALLVVAAAVAGACAASFDIDLPVPPVPGLELVSVESTISVVRPGQQGIDLVASLHNAGTGSAGAYVIEASAFDAAGPRGDVEIRQIDLLPVLAPGATEDVRFEIAVSTTASDPFSVSVAIAGSTDSALEVAFTLPSIREIVVDSTGDEIAADGETSLREAIIDAVGTAGIERITFAASVFPPGDLTVIGLSNVPDGLPVVNALDDAIVIEGRGRVALGMNGAQGGKKVFGLRLRGPVTVAGLSFDGWAASTPQTGQPDNSCYNGPDDTGGAIQVVDGDGAALLRLGISDKGQGFSRSCWHAAIRVDGGTSHRIRDSVFETFNGDAIRVRASMSEISGNLFRNEPTTGPERREADSAIVVESLGGDSLLIAGNVIVEMNEFTPAGITTGSAPAISGAGIALTGSDGGAVMVAHNVFARNDGGAVVRRNDRPIVLVNNVYVANANDLESGAGATLSSETFGPGVNPCNPSCPSAALDVATFLEIPLEEMPSLVASSSNDAREDWTPLPGSPLVDSGSDVIDRNGSATGRFVGSAADRGAVEIP